MVDEVFEVNEVAKVDQNSKRVLLPHCCGDVDVDNEFNYADEFNKLASSLNS